MEPTSSQGVSGAKRRWLQAAGVLLAVAGTAALAAPAMHQAGGPRTLLAQAVAATQLVAPEQAERLVWRGADVDGDGQADFANPTGQATRKTDAYGCGDFGASRDGGVRKHEGVDFMADAGQSLVAPISGYVTKIGFAYPGDSSLKFVEITNPALHYAARVFYIDPQVEVGQAVHLGQSIGVHHTLERKYPGGMTDHVHLEIIDTHGERIDAARLITAHYEPVATPARG
jgi:murein DD-endopeptidase MepM/ murein hydrolase activator NlpD